MLWIRDILVQIRIRGSDPAIFVKTATKKQKKNLRVFAYYFLKIHLHHFSKLKSPKEVTKKQESRFFLPFLFDYRRIRTQIREAQNVWIRMRIRYPDLEH